VPAGPPADSSTGPVTRGVQILDFSFSPGSLDARVGDTITFVNAGQASHTATADNGAFDSGILGRGGTFSTRLTQEGTISYLCQIHPDMTGSITVGPGAAPSSSGPSPGATGADPGGTPPGEAAPARADVEVRDFEFAPSDVTIAQGGTVAWTWVGEAPHSVTADDGSFDSEVLESGATFERVFDAVGEFAYTCLVHPDMTATVNVVAAGAEDASAEIATARQGASSDGGGPSSLVWGLLAGAAMLGMTGLLFVAARRLAALEQR
jgi:plastocyanin